MDVCRPWHLTWDQWPLSLPGVVRWKSPSIKQLALFGSSTPLSVLGSELEFRFANHCAFSFHKSVSEVCGALSPSLNDCRGHKANLWQYPGEKGQPKDIILLLNITIVFFSTPTETCIDLFLYLSCCTIFAIILITGHRANVLLFSF